MMGEVEEGKT